MTVNVGGTLAACRDEGPGAPAVVLIHGVGFGPETLAPVVDALSTRLPAVGVHVHTRRGYGARSALAPAPSVAAHVEDLIEMLDEAGIQRAVIAGMSGGATVALAAALCRPDRVVRAVAHEPAVGSLGPELRSMIVAALGQGGLGLVRFLAGERTWAALDAEALADLADVEPLIEADAGAFARYEPHFPPDGVAVPLICSLGERSDPARYLVAERLSARTGAPVILVPRCGHLPQFDAPTAFAELILNHALTLEVPH